MMDQLLAPTVLVPALSALGLLVSAVVALSKRKPELTQVLVSSAGEIVVMQKGMLAQQESRIGELESAVKEMRGELKELSQSRDRYRQDLREAEREVESLRDRVDLLEEKLRENDIPIPTDT